MTADPTPATPDACAKCGHPKHSGPLACDVGMATTGGLCGCTAWLTPATPEYRWSCPDCGGTTYHLSCPTPATPDEAVAALAGALRSAVDIDPHTDLWYSGVVSVEAHREGFARHVANALAAAGWSLSRQDTTDDAVAALRGDLYLRLLDHYGSPGHAMDVATQVAAALGPGWTLSRQQGDAVAVTVGDVARRLHEGCVAEWEARRARDPDRQFTQHGPDAHRGLARRLLGLGDQR